MTKTKTKYDTCVWLIDDNGIPSVLVQLTLGEVVDAHVSELLHRPFLERLNAAEDADIMPAMWWDEVSANEALACWLEACQ